MRLSPCSGHADLGRFTVFEWRGRHVRGYDSAMVALRILELLRDEEIDAMTKDYVLQQLLFPDPEAVRAGVEDYAGLIAHLLWEVAGIDADGSHDTGGEAVFDWDQDEAVIKVSLFQAYGKPLEELARTMTYRDLTMLMGMISNDTPLGKAIYYRTADEPKPTKYNQEEIKAFRERKAFWRLRKDWKLGNRNTPERIEAMNNQATDMFSALERAAKNGARRKRNN